MKINVAIKAASAALVLGSLLAGCGGGADTKAPDATSTDNKDGKTASTTGAKEPRKMPTAEGNKATGDTIIVGLVASQNGDQKPWGDDNVKGAQLALDDFNAAGGIAGKKVELRIGDSGSKPEQGKSAAEKLMADGALVLDGEVASGITMQMGQAAFEKGVPVVAVGATRTDLTELGANMFRVCYADDFQGPVMANFAYTGLGLHKVAVITDKKLPYSTGLSDSFKATYKKLGGEIVDEEFYEQGQKDFKGQLTNVKAKNPEGIFCSGYFNEVGPLAKQAHDLGITAKLMGGDGWDSPTIITAGGDGIIGGYFCNHYNDKDSRPQVATFLSHWAKKYPTTPKPGTTMGALGYDAMALTLDAIKRAKSLDSKAIMAALEDTEKYPAVSGDITLKGMRGTPPKRALVVEVTKDGFVFKKDYTPDQVTK